jgi:glyoxylase-like metal-dependent hydrolase (beta-lactamase superfamily II)
MTIDCQFIRPQCAAAYLLIGGGRAAFVDNNTTRAVPLLLRALDEHSLRPEQVEYLIITHIHLDHAGGTGTLLAACPNATVVAHPRAERHLVNPGILVASAKKVYGEKQFAELYGAIPPVPADRIRVVEDGEVLRLGERALTCLHTRGHAKHHICIHDSESNGVFAGDAFGVAYGALQCGTTPFVLCSASPTDFEPEEARRSLQRIMDTGAGCVYFTHYGSLPLTREAASQFLRSVDAMDAIYQDALATNHTGDALKIWCEERVRAAVAEILRGCGLALDEETAPWVEPDIGLNAAGIAWVVQKARSDRV